MDEGIVEMLAQTEQTLRKVCDAVAANALD